MKKAILFIFCLLIIILLILSYIQMGEVGAEVDGGDTEHAGQMEGSGQVKITFLDIGQGDATFIEFPDGQQMLVDCAIDARILEALGRVMPFFDNTIDYMLVTHPDKDHYGGCIDVLDRFEVENIIYTGVKKDQSFYEAFDNAMDGEGAEYHHIAGEDVWNIASTTIHFLYPDHDVSENHILPGFEKDTGYNNASIAFTLEYNGNTALFTGDAEEEEEEYLLSTYDGPLDVDILKGGHHGSSGASIPEFLEAVSPEHVIFSAGRENSYGHPSRRVLKRVERVGGAIWRTDTQGDVIVTLGEDIYVEAVGVRP
ncbi:MAG: MBL fold metallo-hydrolase [Candidatus Magasanikbacteria bacterium]|jgi:competence protein ComEC|nr:MBL fold metallo-hydrolase [Candidatus Magasanikbacteria bacterium]MBT4071895.1 MBL fold metallo-hydrolase [Candidatus Magasanikbacteria bacterium]